MRKLFLLSITSLLITSCYSTKTVDEIAQKKYAEKNKPLDTNPNFTIINQFSSDDLIKTKKSHYYFIPALFYWGSSQTCDSELNSNICISLLSEYANKYADSIGFKNKLLNKKIYLNVRSIPNKFKSRFSYSLIIAGSPGYYGSAMSWNKFKITPDNSDLEIEYTIAENEKIIENDILIINDNYFSEPNPMYIKNANEKKQKNFIYEYLNTYDLHIKMLSIILVDKLIEKL